MSSHLTVVQIEKICRMISTWEGSITWEKILERMKSELGIASTRPTISTKLAIQKAYRSKKTSLENPNKQAAQGTSYYQMAQRILQHQRERIEELENQISCLLDLNARISYNAYGAGISKDRLLLPLPPIDREPTRKQPSHEKNSSKLSRSARKA